MAGPSVESIVRSFERLVRKMPAFNRPPPVYLSESQSVRAQRCILPSSWCDATSGARDDKWIFDFGWYVGTQGEGRHDCRSDAKVHRFKGQFIAGAEER